MRGRRRAEPDGAARMLAIALGLGRVAIAAGLWLAPHSTTRALGFEDLGAPGLTLARIAGARDGVLAAWQLSALEDRAELRRASIAVAACDGADAAAFALALRSGESRAGARGLAAAAPAALAGGWLARRLV